MVSAVLVRPGAGELRSPALREEQPERGSSHTSHPVVLGLETLPRSDPDPAGLGTCGIPIQPNYTDKRDLTVYAKVVEVTNVYNSYVLEVRYRMERIFSVVLNQKVFLV